LLSSDNFERKPPLAGLRIAVVGGGHIGAVLGLALLRKGADISIFTQFSAAQLRAGRILSSQCIWGTASKIEDTWAPSPWQREYAGIGGFSVRILNQNTLDVESTVEAALESPGNSVDQRLKVSSWLETFEARGGKLIVGAVTKDDLNNIATSFDLVIVSAGKFWGDLGELFPRDPKRSRHATVQRIGAVVYLKGRPQELSISGRAQFEEWSVVPGIGDFFAIPAFAESGNCHIICMEGFVGGPLDLFQDVRAPDEILRLTRGIFERWLPWEVGRWNNAILIDGRAAICGGFAPTVREPVSQLPNGKPVMAFGDAHVLLDPLTAQGANLHLKNLPLLLERIIAADGMFTSEWMHETAELIWQKSTKVDAVSEQYLNPQPHLWDIFRAAGRSRKFGTWWVNAHFDRPTDLLPWIESGQQTSQFLNRACAERITR
jgi:hypothetical protein